jgi:hypothetical protein
MSTTAEEANFVLGLINKLLNPKMKKFIRISMPNVHELLSSKFLDSGKGSLKLKKKKKKMRSTKKEQKSTKKKGGAAFSFFGSKKSKTVDDVTNKIYAGETLTNHDATILCGKIDEVAATNLMSIIISNEDIPGAKDVIQIYNRFMESQKEALAIVEEKIYENKALVKAELKELELSKIDTRVKDMALTICEETEVPLAAVRKMVATKTKNVESAAQRNEYIKLAAHLFFAVSGMVVLVLFFQFMYKFNSLMAGIEEWFASFQYVCTTDPSWSEWARGAVGEARDCKAKHGFGLVNAISDMITTVAKLAGEFTAMGKCIFIIYSILQFTAVPLAWGFVGYYGILCLVRNDDKEEMAALRECVETQTQIQKSIAQARADAKITVKQLANFVGTQSHESMTTPTVIEMNSSGSKKSRDLPAFIDTSIEEIEEPIAEGALRKTSGKSKRRSMRSRARLPSRKTRRPSRRRN